MTEPEAHAVRSREVLGLIAEILKSRGVQAFLVGGFLRDLLLGVSTRDIDLAVVGDAPSLARDLAERLDGSFVPLGERHQMARVVFSVQGEEWQVDLAGLQGTLQEDLARRDFTIDAMALSLDEWGSSEWREHLLDPFGGQEDLRQGVVRAVSDVAFRADPARLLRTARLAATLGFYIDGTTQRVIARDAGLLGMVAAERVRDEFLALVSLRGAKEHLEALDGLGLLTQVVPELEVTKGVTQPREHYWDVFRHSLETVSATERVTEGPRDDPVLGYVPWDARRSAYFAEVVSDGHTRRTLMKLAALLHDIAKPATKAVDSEGRTRFLGHTGQGASVAEEVLGRLRLSSRGVEMVSGMVAHHLRPTQMSQGVDLPTPRAVYRYFRDLGDIAIDTLYLCFADYLAARGPNLVLDDWQRHVRIVGHILETGLAERTPQRSVKLINGHDLMKTFDLPAGAFLGAVLEAVHEAQALGEVKTREEALAWVGRYIEKKGKRSA